MLKKDKKSLRLVHDLQPLNAVAIIDPAVPPSVEPYVESFGCYGMFDLFVGFDQIPLAPQSRDMTTFQTPLGTFQLTSIPMGYTNSMQIFHRDIMFLLQEEIPHITKPFINDILVKGPTSRYQDRDGTYLFVRAVMQGMQHIRVPFYCLQYLTSTLYYTFDASLPQFHPQ